MVRTTLLISSVVFSSLHVRRQSVRTHHTPGKKNIEKDGKSKDKKKKKIHVEGMDKAVHRLRLIGAEEKTTLNQIGPFLSSQVGSGLSGAFLQFEER